LHQWRSATRAAAGNAEPGSRLSRGRRNGYSFSTDTSVALIIAKTVSPSLRFIRFTEPVVIIQVTSPALVRMTTSDTTLSETIFSIVPRRRFQMLVLMVIRRMCYRTTSTVIIMPVFVFQDVAVKYEASNDFRIGERYDELGLTRFSSRRMSGAFARVRAIDTR
jgi:hypothetical protein